MLRRATICLIGALWIAACEPDPLPDGEQPPPDYLDDRESVSADHVMHWDDAYAA